MLPTRAIRANRIPVVRRLRPPSSVSKPRLFTQNAQLLLLAPHTSRPHLPYLSQPSFRRLPPTNLSGPNQQIARLLSTENKRYLRDQFWLAVRWGALTWGLIIAGSLAWWGYNIELHERETPTPDEWSFWSRQKLRISRMRQNDEEGTGIIDWANVGSTCKNLLARLENPNSKDGKGIKEVVEGGVFIDEVGKAGFDISDKSWPWRAGYFEAVMGCALAAEHLDGMVLDSTRHLVFPKEVMIGPSNPDPRPVPTYMHTAPLEENCVEPFEKPETYYMRILTGRGFTTTQKLDAALGYANWLEIKGLNDSALEMYRWGLDIAKESLPAADTIIDPETAVIKDTSAATGASANLLRATTSLAIHYARTGDVSAALPILLSTLRARRSAPVSNQLIAGSKSSISQPEGPGTGLRKLVSILSPPNFPPPPPSGDEPYTNATDRPSCDDAELMLYVGEILFATTGQAGLSDGIGWTRQAVTVAEATLHSPELRSAPPLEARAQVAKCRDCLSTGVGNWETMLAQLTRQAESVASREGVRNSGWLEWRGWFGSGGGAKGKVLDELSIDVVEDELARVTALKKRIVREGIDRQLEKHRHPGGGLWMGR
ncbi:hypothetical protein K431DRAFT_281649 [Polychaeton citri CBS 116435]|uniref:MFS maltose permease n=1 Tax=Polychaeton citri CBS 116435 TaxID=1314669 RepID=A0A9P4QGX7_9PEZI|nr:hypothetical protein K431DRAFT_281649 [Polychaeton citri CBS 116435]